MKSVFFIQDYNIFLLITILNEKSRPISLLIKENWKLTKLSPKNTNLK